MKKALFAVAAVAVLAVAAQAGEIKIHTWPCTLTPLEITQIPVYLKVGYFVKIEKQDELKITLGQESIHTYTGCVTMTVKTNTPIQLSASIARTGPVPGDYSCSITGGGNLPALGSYPVEVCARVDNADLAAAAGNTTPEVARVTIKVVPTSL